MKYRLTCGSIFSVATTFVLIIVSTSIAYAFVPGGSKAFGTGGKSHKEITEEALDRVYASYPGASALTKPMKEAREQITDANALVDDENKGHAGESAWHCDAENLQGCSDLIGKMLQATIDSLQADDVSSARSSLGQALHTLQDFYSHSNWIELGNGSPLPELGRGVISNVAPPSAITCDAAPIGNLCYEGNLRTSVTRFLTSGYFGKQDRTGDFRPWKCRHGGSWDSTPGYGGINKDSTTCFLVAPFVSNDLTPVTPETIMYAPLPVSLGLRPPLPGDSVTLNISPHEDGNLNATSVAQQATYDALLDLFNRSTGVGRVTEVQFKALLGIGPSLAFAIDTTGSMGGEITGVKADVLRIISERKGTADEATRYILSPFNDPFVGPLTSTSDPDIFTLALNSLFASGGGDCPELSMEGLYNAVSASENGGQVFLYTDASAKDAIKKVLVYALAFAKDVKIFNALYGSCSPYDPAYFDTANRTGGQVFLLRRGQTAGVSQLANILASSSSADILSAAGLLTGVTTTHDFPVDSQTSRITISATSTAGAVVSIIRPDGSIVSPADAGVTQIPVNSVATTAIYTIVNPSVGLWHVSLAGSGDYSVLVNGASALTLDGFRFVRRGGRPGHEGYYPIDGFPLTGTTQNVIARLSGNPQSVVFELRKRNGELVQSFNLNSPEADHGELLGEIAVPAQPFVVYAVGKDGNGVGFQRVIAKQYTPQPISIISPASVGLAKGKNTTYVFQVKNDGPAGLFQFSSIDDRKYVASVTPNSASIPTGGTADVTVVLQVPLSALAGTSDTVTFVARSSSNPEVSNSAVLLSRVVESNQPPLANAGPDQTVECAGQGGTSVTLNGSASSDPDGDPLTFTWTGPFGTASGPTPTVTLPMGINTITLTVSDGKGGTSSATVTVKVVDTTPPTIGAVTATPNILWPPNHKMVPVAVSASASDACSAVTTCKIISVRSNEPVDGTGDGDTAPDWVITGNLAANLRAERAGAGSGRTYTLTVQCTDTLGNSSTKDVIVSVPHNR